MKRFVRDFGFLMLWGLPGILMACVSTDMTQPGDPVLRIGLGPDPKGPALVIDDDPNTVFCVSQYGGFCLTPACPESKVVAIKVFASPEAPGSTPLEYELYGANRGLDGPYAWMGSGSLDYVDEIPLWAETTFPTATVSIAPDARYNHYQLLFPLAGDESECVQVVEVELFNACEIYSRTPWDLTEDVPLETLLSWRLWHDDVTYDVYLSTDVSDVNQAERDCPLDALVSCGQGLNVFEPNDLVWNTTYYWRVDEVNSGPDPHITRGRIQSFTTEPYAYPVEEISASASGAVHDDRGPDKTIDYSGLNFNDEHSTDSSDMWLTPTEGSWIQYEFEQVCLLDSLWVWNYNDSMEFLLGQGVKNATIVTSLDGVTWSPISDVPQFGQGTGKASGGIKYTREILLLMPIEIE